MTYRAFDPNDGQMVTPEEFITKHGAQWRRRGILPPRCPCCQEDLHLYGAHSLNVTTSFHHPDGTTCMLSSASDPRLKGLKPAAGWDVSAGRRLKSTFCTERHLSQGYAACHALCLRRLRAHEFVRFCHLADDINLWAYKGMNLTLIPYVLVTLDDLDIDEQVKRHYPLRLVLQKPRHMPIDALWTTPDVCRIVPVFTDSGRPLQMEPFRIPDPRVERARTDTRWISKGLLARLRECCRHQP